MKKSVEKLEYNGKLFTIPIMSSSGDYILPQNIDFDISEYKDVKILEEMNTIWNLDKFHQTRTPIKVDTLNQYERELMDIKNDIRILDMPIKFPDSNEFRIPEELRQFIPIFQKIINIEYSINNRMSEYYCYLSVAQNVVRQGTLHREAPCHVDGFQGALWNPKVEINHTYTVENGIPTTFYNQPFDFSLLDDKKHNFFWEMNRQVALTNSQYAHTFDPYDIVLMNAYNVHRGSECQEKEKYRTWIRLSFEKRIFNRLGNTHNPMFEYNWNMIPRDIESLNLIAYDENSDPSLRVFPWETIKNQKHLNGEKTKPILKK